MKFAIALAAAMSLASACSKGKDSSDESSAGAATGSENKGSDLTAGDESTESSETGGPPRLEESDIEIARDEQKATLRAAVPAGWVKSDAGNGVEFQPENKLPGIWQPLLSFSFGGHSCSGECKDEDFKRERDGVLEGLADSLVRPNLNTGKPELDAVRLDVTELEKGDLSGGGYVAHRVAIPSDLPKELKRPYFEGIQAICSRFRPGDDFYIVVTVRIPVAGEKALWPLLLEACKRTEVKN